MRPWLWGALLAGCTSSQGTPDDTDDPVATPENVSGCGFAAAADLDPDPDVVEVAFDASMTTWDPGVGAPIRGMSFGGAVPGPQIEVRVGQTLRVRFVNHLDAPTTIHWHGLRVPEAMDGIAQMDDPIEPGESFTYEYVVKDAGFYWYHPHMETAETIEAGLYGVIVARAPDEVAPACEVPLALDDILLDREGQIEPPGTDMDQVMGRLGDTLLVNGRADRVIEVPAGGQVVLRMVATSNARHFDLGFEGLGLQLLGTDGGYLPDARALDRVRLAPGERAIVSFQAPADPGAELVLMNRRVQLHEEDADETAMHEIDPMGDEDHAILRFVTIDADPGAPWVAPAFDPPVAVTEGAPAHTWVLEEDMMAGVLTIDGAEWPDVPMVMFDGGAPTTLVIDNRSEMRHPFHTHGNRYIVTSIGGAPVADRAWKDTFDVPPRTAVTVVSELDNPGMWMYHCHILEHADRGMAGMMVVR